MWVVSSFFELCYVSSLFLWSHCLYIVSLIAIDQADPTNESKHPGVLANQVSVCRKLCLAVRAKLNWGDNSECKTAVEHLTGLFVEDNARIAQQSVGEFPKCKLAKQFSKYPVTQQALQLALKRVSDAQRMSQHDSVLSSLKSQAVGLKERCMGSFCSSMVDAWKSLKTKTDALAASPDISWKAHQANELDELHQLVADFARTGLQAQRQKIQLALEDCLGVLFDSKDC